jgi:urease accessory protein
MNLRLLQICDSALPIGGYTHSWGLEAAIDRRLVTDAGSLEQWVRGWLRHALGPLEGVIVASACRATAGGDWPIVALANVMLTASISPPSIRTASREMGEQLLGLASTWEWSAGGVVTFGKSVSLGDDWRQWNHAVVFGLLGALAGGSPLETLLAYLHQAVLGMVGAGVRAGPMGHTHGQQILAYLHPELEQLATALSERELTTVGSGCPFYEVLCDEQTRLYSRLFRS